ncbi:MAG: PQQ-binding-like beta-propeller repeat protein [Rickettsiales bacterium]|nr:PQQ-binding-like beta-propeller repeat protein [Rickettsiales bacterium]
MMIRKISFFPLFIIFSLAGCSSSNRGDVFVDYFGKNLVVKKDNKTSKYRLNGPIKGEVNIFKNGDDVYVASKSNSITKFSLKDNKMVWHKTIASVPMANFAFNDGKLFFTTINNGFYILNGETGKIEFIYSNANRMTVSVCIEPMFYKNLIIVTFNDGEIIIFDKNSRNILKKITSKFLAKFSVALENNLLSVNDEKIDLDKIGKQ